MIPYRFIIIAILAVSLAAGAVFAVKTYKDAIAEQERLTGELRAANAANEQTKATLVEVKHEYDNLASLAEQRRKEAQRQKLLAAKAERELHSLVNAAAKSGDFAALNGRVQSALERIQGARFDEAGEAGAAARPTSHEAGPPFAYIDRRDTEALITNLERVATYIERLEEDYGNNTRSIDQ